jgi:3-isopropylmalate dehydrogenase
MFGDILSDEAAELSGSLGLAAGLNVGDKMAVAQAQHGSAPDIAGLEAANPTSLILSAAMLLAWLGTHRNELSLIATAEKIDAAVDATLADPAKHTADLGGTLRTQDFAAAVVDAFS